MPLSFGGKQSQLAQPSLCHSAGLANWKGSLGKVNSRVANACWLNATTMNNVIQDAHTGPDQPLI